MLSSGPAVRASRARLAVEMSGDLLGGGAVKQVGRWPRAVEISLCEDWQAC